MFSAYLIYTLTLSTLFYGRLNGVLALSNYKGEYYVKFVWIALVSNDLVGEGASICRPLTASSAGSYTEASESAGVK